MCAHHSVSADARWRGIHHRLQLLLALTGVYAFIVLAAEAGRAKPRGGRQ
jgi:hypothetical protein